MTKDRLPWFKCYPTLLIGALTGMPPDVGYVYTFVLLRTYEVEGACPDTAAVLSRRTGLTLKRVENAVDWLLDQGKLTRSGVGLVNPFAAKVLSERNQATQSAVSYGKIGGEKSAAKRKAKSIGTAKPPLQLDEGSAKPGATDLDLDLDSDLDSKGKKEARVAAPKNRGSRIDPEWKPSDAEIAFAKQEGFNDFETKREANKFRDYWAACAGAKGVKLDWRATWRQWIRSGAERSGKTPPPNNGPTGGPTSSGYYAKADSDQLAAWDSYNRTTTGKTLARDRNGGWHVKSEWPPGHGFLPLDQSTQEASR